MGNIGNILGWLFTDPQTAGASSASGLAQPFPYYALWLVILGLAIVVPVYYSVEGRRKISWIKDHMIWKQYVFDRMAPQLGWWGFVGLIVILFRYIANSTPFAWPIWIVLLIGWGVGIVAYWLYYFIRRHNSLMVSFDRQRERQKFLPTSNRKRRTASAR